MDNDSSLLCAVASSIADMSASALKFNVSSETMAAITGIYESLSLVPLNTSVQNFADVYESVISREYTCLPCSSLLNEFNHVLSSYSPISAASESLVKCAKSVLSISEPLCTTKERAAVFKTMLESSSVDDSSDSNEYIEISQSLATAVKQVDESVQLPESDEHGNIRVHKSGSADFWQILAIIIAIIAMIQSSYYHHEDAVSSSQDHSELMREAELQTHELKTQTSELMKQTELLKQIKNNISKISSPQNSDSVTKQSES